MSNCLFAYPNLADGATLSGGSWEASLPLTNLQDARLAKLARSTDDAKASTLVNVDLTESRVLRVVSVLSHNMSLAALIRVRFGDDSAFASDNFDSGWVDAYPVIYPGGVLSFGDSGWFDGKLGQEDLDLGYPVDYHLLISPIVQGRYLRIEIDDTANTDTYVEFGRLWISTGYQPSINMQQGGGLGYETSSTRTESDGGPTFHNERPRRRVANFTVPMIPENEALVKLFEINRRLGTHDPFLFMYNPADTHHLHRRSFLGTLKELSPLALPYATRADQPMSVVEEL